MKYKLGVCLQGLEDSRREEGGKFWLLSIFSFKEFEVKEKENHRQKDKRRSGTEGGPVMP